MFEGPAKKAQHITALLATLNSGWLWASQLTAAVLVQAVIPGKSTMRNSRLAECALQICMQNLKSKQQTLTNADKRVLVH